MNEINRMANPIVPTCPADIDFMDQELRECPYPAFDLLREDAPVWFDERTNAYVVTRYADIRAVILNPKLFISTRPREADIVNQARNDRLMHAYTTRGWVPAPTLALRDNPEHDQLRSVYDQAFRNAKIKELEPYVAEVSHKLIDAFINDGRCNFARQFAYELPLIVTCKQMGVPVEDRYMIKGWTDMWTTRTGSAAETDEVFDKCVDAEIEAQHYFQKIFDRLRIQPDESLLSDLVNTEIPGWGRKMNDNELHAAMMADTFVGGAETTAHTLTSAFMLLDERPGMWEKLKSDPGKYLRVFFEEVLRLESPVQSRVRIAAEDTELDGVKIPKGAVIDLRYGAGNRDERQFAEPNDLNLDRTNAATHVAFAAGVHHCLGAPLARRELLISMTILLNRIKDFKLVPGANNFRHIPHYFLRGIIDLHMTFTPEPQA